MSDFQQVDMNEKLDLLMSAINKINTNFHIKFEELNEKITDEQQGILPRLIDIEANITDLKEKLTDEHQGILQRLIDAEAGVADLQERMDNLEETNTSLKDEMPVIKGLLQANDNRVSNIDRKVVDLTMRSMSNNVIITGILGDTDGESDCKAKVLDLLRHQMKMTVEDHEIKVAHRAKGKRGLKPRSMISRCSFSLREHIFAYTKHLKDCKNADGDYYFVQSNCQNLYTHRKENVTRKLRR